jgi:hypothetical protein
MKRLLFTAAALLLAACAARVEPLPVATPPGPGGSCPHGYTSSGSYCVPDRGAQPSPSRRMALALGAGFLPAVIACAAALDVDQWL